MPDIRSQVKLNSTPMAGIYGSGKTFNAYYGVCSSNLTSFSTYTLIPGTNVSVVVPVNGSTVIAIGTVDQQINVSGGSSIECAFSWNGTQQNQIPFFQSALSTSWRMTNGHTWVLTGISSGTYTAELQASCPSGGTIRTTHTTLTILVISG